MSAQFRRSWRNPEDVAAERPSSPSNSRKRERARPGFEPGTSRTLSENHTPRPTSQPHGKALPTRTKSRKPLQCQGQRGIGGGWHPCKKHVCFRPGSNRRPCACEAHVITTTLRKHVLALLEFMAVEDCCVFWHGVAMHKVLLFLGLPTAFPAGSREVAQWRNG